MRGRKKFYSLIIVAVLIAAGCSKGNSYMQDLAGTWTVYKYTLRLMDKKSLFDGYNITFTNNGHIIERSVVAPDTTYVGGSYSFKSNYAILALVDTVPVLVDTVWVTTIRERDFSIINLTPVHLQLRTDSSEIYLSKTL